MSRGLLAVATLLVATGLGVLLYLTRDRGTSPDPRPPEEPPGTQAREIPDPQRVPGNRYSDRPSGTPDVAPERPALPAPEGDPDWAERTRRMVDEVARGAIEAAQIQGVEVGEVECRQATCRFELDARRAQDLADAMAVLEDDRGFADLASQLLWTDMKPGAADGPAAVTVVLSFD